MGQSNKNEQTHICTHKDFYILKSLSGKTSTDGQQQSYFKKLKWVPIPVSVGFAYVGYQQYRHVVKREEAKLDSVENPEDLLFGDWVITLYKCFPLKILSRFWGRFNDVEIPEFMRPSVFKMYIRLFNCNLEEAAVRDLKHYKNMNEFFCRRLRPGIRPINRDSNVISPSDGRVLHFGRAEKGSVEQVKGVNYALQDLLGPLEFAKPEADNQSLGKLDTQLYQGKLKKSADSELFHCVIYLAPGDYHGIHSPTEWTVSHRRHFPGELFSVNPGVCRLVRGIFNLNERVVYVGEWEHGFFSMIPVGATNVGTIKVYHDQSLETNMPYKYSAGAFFDQSFCYTDTTGIPLKRGDAFGEFKMGSSVVLVFEAPPSFRFEVEPGQVIKYGQPLGRIYKEPNTRRHEKG